MYLQDGRSIADCQMQLEAAVISCHRRTASADVKSTSDGRMPEDDTDFSKPMDTDCSKHILDTDDGNDNVCQVCGDGGELVLCDSCPAAFHTGCLDLDSIPDGDWFCYRCRCGYCGGNCFSEEAGKTILCCAQCDVYYHRSCVKPNRAHELAGQWFCGHNCQDVFEKTRRLVGSVNPLENGLYWTLVRSVEEDEGAISISKKAYAENQSKLSTALEVLRECFDPIVDYETNTDLLSQTLFNRKSKSRRLNCSGFYTMLLARRDQVISVATIRIHCSSVAEMPFIGTRHQFRQQGMCRQLMVALETMLRGMGVYRLILPSVPELLGTWTEAFGFSYMRFSVRKEVSKLNLMSFPGTTLLQKRLLSSEPVLSNERSLSQVETAWNGDSSPAGKFRFKLHQTKGPYSNRKPALNPISCN